MNTFYIILYTYYYDNKMLFSFLSDNFCFAKGHTFEQLQWKVSQSKDTTSNNHKNNIDVYYICFSMLLAHYGEWFKNEKYEKRIIYTPPKLKFSFLKKQLKNVFCDDKIRKKIITIFGKSQKHYLALNRFAYLWKLKRAQVSVYMDLYFNDIEIEKKHAFVLYQNHKKFYFVLSDLLNIIESSIAYTWEGSFNVLSKAPRNPYNNEPFKKHDLYNIYYHIHFNSRIVMPVLLHLWFLEKFDLNKFALKHQNMIQKACIRHFIWNVANTSSIVYGDVMEMINENRLASKWKIHKDFPKEVLVDVMRPYLYLYYLIQYDVLDFDEDELFTTKLCLYLNQAYRYNPQFGRRIVKVTRSSPFHLSNFDKEFRKTLQEKKSSGEEKPFIFGKRKHQEIIAPRIDVVQQPILVEPPNYLEEGEEEEGEYINSDDEEAEWTEEDETLSELSLTSENEKITQKRNKKLHKNLSYEFNTDFKIISTKHM